MQKPRVKKKMFEVIRETNRHILKYQYFEQIKKNNIKFRHNF